MLPDTVQSVSVTLLRPSTTMASERLAVSTALVTAICCRAVNGGRAGAVGHIAAVLDSQGSASPVAADRG